jgi:3-phenylpropionate/trans-cinnamate dioxygenase ferredoxin reductase component
MHSETFMSDTIVIVGAGQAGAQLALNLRNEGHEGPIVLVGAEPHPPYQRPPLSKHHLAGKVGLDKVLLKPEAVYAEQGIELRSGCRVTAIDRAARRLTLDDGATLDYGKLALATGSKVRRLDLPGVDLGGIHYLRTLDDMRTLQAGLQAGTRLVLVGGGYIGLEVASVAVQLGLEVVVLEQAEQLMARVVGLEIGDFYHELHSQAGVDLRTGVTVTGFEGDDEVTAVRCADGSEVAADRVLIGVGVLPDVELAEAAGLEVDNGILVDEHASTGDPAIVALGDCANFPSARYGGRLRLESVPNAMATARTAAATLCGKERPYTEVPWFWSDQYDKKLQIAGVRDGHDQVIVRGDLDDGRFMVLYLRDGELLAAEAVNNPREFMTVRQLIGQRARPDPDRLGDPDAPLSA